MTDPIATPYSGPQGLGQMATRPDAGLYLPPDQRLQPKVTRTTPTDLLSGEGPVPWIDAFLAATPAFGVMAMPEATEVPPPARPGPSSAESAAQALEMLALRVRAGELPLTGYDPALGDAAALVAALAALLGVRLAE